MEQYSDIAMNFCRNVKLLRETLQVPKNVMGELCGIDAVGIRGVEHGCLSIDLVLKILASVYKNLHVPPAAMISENVLLYRL